MATVPDKSVDVKTLVGVDNPVLVRQAPSPVTTEPKTHLAPRSLRSTRTPPPFQVNHFRPGRFVLPALPVRQTSAGLTLHPEKTKLVPFRRPDRQRPDEPPPGSFQLRIHARVGSLPHRQVDYQAQDCKRPFQCRTGANLSVVQEASSRPDKVTAASPKQKAARSLWILWNNR